MNTKLTRRSRSGLTLVEIMIVVAIVGLLGFIAIGNVVFAKQKKNEKTSLLQLTNGPISVTYGNRSYIYAPRPFDQNNTNLMHGFFVGMSLWEHQHRDIEVLSTQFIVVGGGFITGAFVTHRPRTNRVEHLER